MSPRTKFRLKITAAVVVLFPLFWFAAYVWWNDFWERHPIRLNGDPPTGKEKAVR